jgi:two-component system CheB/CheR fusion protein
VATVFLDRHLVIRNFTPAVTGLFDLVGSDRGGPLSSFASRIDSVDFGSEARRVLDQRLPVERRVTAQGGTAHYLMRMLPYTTAEGRWTAWWSPSSTSPRWWRESCSARWWTS